MELAWQWAWFGRKVLRRGEARLRGKASVQLVRLRYDYFSVIFPVTQNTMQTISTQINPNSGVPGGLLPDNSAGSHSGGCYDA